jgi:vitamin B12 transporter
VRGPSTPSSRRIAPSTHRTPSTDRRVDPATDAWRPLALALGAALALLVPAVGAQPSVIAAAKPATSSPEAAGPLDAVTVTASRTPSRVGDTVAEVTGLERADIERANGRSLAELLAQQPGLQVSSNGGLGKTSSVFIRGLESRHTLLLVDGVRLGSATVGTPSWDNLPLDTIERIEIVRGPRSSLYGADAIGGVVQIFTRRGRDGASTTATPAAPPRPRRRPPASG